MGLGSLRSHPGPRPDPQRGRYDTTRRSCCFSSKTFEDIEGDLPWSDPMGLAPTVRITLRVLLLDPRFRPFVDELITDRRTRKPAVVPELESGCARAHTVLLEQMAKGRAPRGTIEFASARLG